MENDPPIGIDDQSVRESVEELSRSEIDFFCGMLLNRLHRVLNPTQNLGSLPVSELASYDEILNRVFERAGQLRKERVKCQKFKST